MRRDVITCGRCGRENRGSRGPWLDNGRYGPGSWEESGWVVYDGASIARLDEPVGPRHSGRSMHVCPGCLTDEERGQLEGFAEVADWEPER